MNGNVAIIPARGGSKRIPRKNILEFAGIPLIGRTILMAKETKLFEKILVTTDDEEIATIAAKFGAEIPRLRSKNLSDDFATTYDVMADSLTHSWLGEFSPKYACCIYPVTPLLTANRIREAYDLIKTDKYPYVFSAIGFNTPIERSFRIGNTGNISMNFPEHLLTRSQDLEQSFHDAGQFYWGKCESWLTKEPIFGPQSTAIKFKDYELVDVDTIEDLKWAETLFIARNKKS